MGISFMKHVQNTTTSKNNDNCNLAPQPKLPKLEDIIILGDELKSSFDIDFPYFHQTQYQLH